MSRNLALEKIGRAKVSYKLMQEGWKVGEVFDDGYDILAYNPNQNKIALIELKAMDKQNRAEKVNLTATLTSRERDTCTHIIAYVEPEGDIFIAKKENILTKKGNIFCAMKSCGEYSNPRPNSKSFFNYKNSWDQLLK